MPDISNIRISGSGAVSSSDTLPSRVYQQVYQKAQAIREEKLARTIETYRLEYGLAILEILLAVRFLFDLFNASSLNLLAKLADVVTFPFTAPFLGLFGKDPSYALSKGELATLAAMLIYPMITWAAIAIIKANQKKAELA